MKLAGASASALLVVAAASAVSGASTQRRAPSFSSQDSPLAGMLRRSVTGNGNTLSGQTFDYVVVGGGLAGLVVANRLSADSNFTVAVIEAGADAYGAGQERILVPAGNLYNSALRSAQDWNWQTEGQAEMGGRQLAWPRGKVLGGSSAVNGLYMVRASAAEHNSWGALAGDSDRWGWDNVYRAMKKSEHFVPPSASVQEVLPDLSYNAASHGQDGSIYTSWPGVAYSSTNDFLQSMAATGTGISSDSYGGENWGAFVAQSSINPNDWSRSFSRNGYLDTAQDRPNLSVLTGHTVTKVLTDGSDANAVRATGVQYAAASGQTVHTVNARREVIISGGAINSPQILQLSGIGDAQQLQRIGIDSIIDLPGVGHNLQDHLASSVSWAAGSGSYPVTGPDASAIQNSFVNSAIGYVNMTTLFGSSAADLVNDARSEVAQRISAANMRDEVKRAWNATMTAQLDKVLDPAANGSPLELLFAYVFGSIQIQLASQTPLSRGTVLATSADPFQAPAIDPQYLSAAIDLAIMREGFKLARRVGETQPLAAALGNEQSPGSGVQTDRQFEAFIRNEAQTEYHPSSTCSQLPRADGGVVDANLLVYGTSNLRVVDASIVPIALSAHLMTATYGLAEVGAELIIEARTPPPSSTTSSAGSEPTGSSTGGGSSAGNNNGGSTSSGGQSSGAPTLSVRSAALFVCGAAVASLLL